MSFFQDFAKDRYGMLPMFQSQQKLGGYDTPPSPQPRSKSGSGASWNRHLEEDIILCIKPTAF